ncbi:S8 family peptidase [Butyrivibrio sp. MC2021]|uniref:S8 family peptidase n=1 Tax=Butyrivibrio sp. MC2021 TaxID=1408306 RepID=UPI00047C7687|nr:S8 family serine peptidase [Butyrivibrio sp. MC2021]
MRRKADFKRVMALGLSAALILSSGNVAAAQEVFLEEEAAAGEFFEEEQFLEEADLDILEDSAEEAPEEISGEADELILEDETSYYEPEAFEDELPDGLCGMPEGYIPSEEEMENKLEARDMLSNMLDDKVPGEDYEDGVIIYSADSEEYAEQVAAAYNAELVDFSYGVAKARITDPELTVAEAVAFGADPTLALPPVSPNHFVTMEDPIDCEVVEDDSDDAELMAAAPPSEWSYYAAKLTDPAIFPRYHFMQKDAFEPDGEGSDREGYQWMHDMVGTYEAWGTTMGKENITVAVIDTGVDVDHEDFKAEGQKRTVSQYTGIYPEWRDVSGHGTHVAGIIGAAINGVGGVGMAPNVSILGIPVFKYEDNKDEADDATIAKAVNYVAGWDEKENTYARKAEIINMSLGGPEYNVALKDACKHAYDAGVTVIASMGNEATNSYFFPAAYDYVIGVAAIDRDGRRSDFSSYGDWADIAAPGSAIYSTWNGHDHDLDTKKTAETDHHDWYAVWNGTSMASPVVSGACALYMSAEGYTSPKDMEAILKNNAIKTKEKGIGAGIVNVAAMMPNTTKIKEIAAPAVYLKRSGSSEVVPLQEGAILSKDDYIYIVEPENGHAFTVAYTVNGKNPGFKNEVLTAGTYGYYAPAAITGAKLIEDGVLPGKEFTFKAVYASPQGTVGKVTTIKKIKVESNDPLTTIKVYGPNYVAAGKTVSYTAVTTPANYAAKGFEWSMVDSSLNELNIKGVTLNSKTGKLKIDKSVYSDTSFYVIAKVKGDESGKFGYVGPVKVKKPIQKVVATLPGNPDKAIYAQKVNKAGVVSSVRLFNQDILETEVKENQIEVVLTNTVEPDYGADISELVVSSNKSGVAYATFDTTLKKWYIRAGSTPGTAKITWTTVDGSKKKTSITVKTIAPVSEIHVNSKNRQQFVAIGKSAEFTATAGNTYGKPSITKVTWDYGVEAFFEGEEEPRDVTNYVKEAKAASVSKTGKVTVRKNYGKVMESLETGYGKAFKGSRLVVKATATDGSKISGSTDIFVVSPVKEIGVAIKFNEEIISDWYKKNVSAEVSIPDDRGEDYLGIVYIYIAVDGPEFFTTGLMTIESNNPKIASPGNGDLDEIDGGNFIKYPVYIRNTGKVNFTVKANDGSKKTRVVTFDVTEDTEKDKEE